MRKLGPLRSTEKDRADAMVCLARQLNEQRPILFTVVLCIAGVMWGRLTEIPPGNRGNYFQCHGLDWRLTVAPSNEFDTGGSTPPVLFDQCQSCSLPTAAAGSVQHECVHRRTLEGPEPFSIPQRGSTSSNHEITGTLARFGGGTSL